MRKKNSFIFIARGTKERRINLSTLLKDLSLNLVVPFSFIIIQHKNVASFVSILFNIYNIKKTTRFIPTILVLR